MAKTVADSSALNAASPATESAVSPALRRYGLFHSFSFRSFRMQWISDSLMSWSNEMENLILAWFVLVQTDSPFLLGLFGALKFLGTLVAPLYGVIADRMDRRHMLIGLRSILAALALIVMTLALSNALEAWHVFIIATLTGMVRVADNVARQAIIADIVPRGSLLNAYGLTRTTQDSAKIAGSLIGASLFAQFGLGVAYSAVTTVYVASAVFVAGVSIAIRSAPLQREPVFRTLKSGVSYMRGSPTIKAVMFLAFLVNLTAFPLSNGLMPVVARDLYGTDETGLAWLLTAIAFGALAGSISMAAMARVGRPDRVMLVGVIVWHLFLILFTSFSTSGPAYPVLAAMGIASSVAMISMTVLMMTTVLSEFRGRVMGVRMLAVYGLPMGLLIGGALAEAFGIQTTITIYGVAGLTLTVLAAVIWPGLWRGGEVMGNDPARDK